MPFNVERVIFDENLKKLQDISINLDEYQLETLNNKISHFIEEPRECIKDFSVLMEIKLKKNDYKGGWNNVPTKSLLNMLKDEVQELEDAINRNHDEDIKSECADVANFAMMISNNIPEKM